MRRARILVADDHALMVKGITEVLSPHCEVVGTVTDGRALVETALRLTPDAIVLDISLPLLNGIDAASRLRPSLPGVKLLFLTMHSSPAYLAAALNAGANGYVLKSAASEELVGALHHVLDDRLYVSPGLIDAKLNAFPNPARAAASFRLSSREREVLQLIAEGHAAKQIGYILSISVKTVSFHRDKIKKKLGLASTAELTRYSIEEGLICGS